MTKINNYLPIKVQNFLGKGSSSPLRNFLARAVAGTLGMKITNVFCIYLANVLLARWLGVEGYGNYTYVLAWVNMLLIPAVLGLEALIPRDVAIYQTQAQWSLARGIVGWSNRLVLCTSLGLALVVIAWVGGFTTADSEQLAIFCLAMVSLPFLALSRLRQGVMQALRCVIKGQIPEMVVRPVVLVLFISGAYFLGEQHLSATTAMTIHALASATTFCVGTFLMWGVMPASLKKATPQYQTQVWFKSALPMLLIAGMYAVNNKTDMIMLGIFQEAKSSVGIYFVANRGAGLIQFVLVAFSVSLAPVFASLYAEGNHHKLREIAIKSSRIIALLALAIAFSLIIFRTQFLGLFGEEYIQGEIILITLIFAQLANALTGSVAVLLNMTNHQQDTAMAVAGSAGLNVILNAIMIPQWGAQGAALATTTTIVMANLYLVVLVRKRLGFYPIALGKI
jgi:O-antigen/teichoic acid export membrane protein